MKPSAETQQRKVTNRNVRFLRRVIRKAADSELSSEEAFRTKVLQLSETLPSGWLAQVAQTVDFDIAELELLRDLLRNLKDEVTHTHLEFDMGKAQKRKAERRTQMHGVRRQPPAADMHALTLASQQVVANRQRSETAKSDKPAPDFKGHGKRTFKLGDFTIPEYVSLLSDYPPEESIPKEFREHNHPMQEVFRQFFFKGGKLESYGLRVKSDYSVASFIMTFSDMLSSFAPSQEHKSAACAWFLHEFTEPR